MRKMLSYIAARNEWYPNSTINFIPNQSEVNSLCKEIDNELAPEKRAVELGIEYDKHEDKVAFFHACFADLKKYCEKNSLQITKRMENIYD